MTKSAFAGCSLLAASILATATVAAEPAEPAPSASSCREPELAERARVTTSELERTGQAMQDYVECMRPVLEADRKRAEELFAAAKAAAEASNAAATEVNAHVDAYRKWANDHADDEQ